MQVYSYNQSVILIHPGFFSSSSSFCHFHINVCVYSTCAFLIVKRILMLIMYSTASL